MVNYSIMMLMSTPSMYFKSKLLKKYLVFMLVCELVPHWFDFVKNYLELNSCTKNETFG